MFKNKYVASGLYGYIQQEEIDKLSVMIGKWDGSQSFSNNKTSIVYDVKGIGSFLLDLIDNYECVHFVQPKINNDFLEYIKICKHKHITLFLNDEIKCLDLSDNIESITIIGIEKYMPIINGKNLKALYMSGFESTDLKYIKKEHLDLIPKNLEEFGLIDSCRVLDLPHTFTCKKIVLIESQCQIISIPECVEQIVLCPLFFCNTMCNDPSFQMKFEIPHKYAHLLHYFNSENLKCNVLIDIK